VPTAQEVRDYRVAQDLISAAARRDLFAIWRTVDALDVDQIRRALETSFPVLVAEYGDAQVAVAAEFFEATISGRAVLAETVPTTQANASMRWALGPVLEDDSRRALARLVGVLDRFVKQPGRDTMRRSALSSGGGWARVPSGSSPCAFCLMLSSRGAVYGSEESAGGMGNSYHADCNCVVVAVRRDSELPYDPDALRSDYERARAAAGSSDPHKILTEMREQLGVS